MCGANGFILSEFRRGVTNGKSSHAFLATNIISRLAMTESPPAA